MIMFTVDTIYYGIKGMLLLTEIYLCSYLKFLILEIVVDYLYIIV